MYQQNGGYIEPKTRLIGFKNEDMGEYLLNLINEQMKVAESLQNYVGINDKNLLLHMLEANTMPMENTVVNMYHQRLTQQQCLL